MSTRSNVRAVIDDIEDVMIVTLAWTSGWKNLPTAPTRNNS